MQHSRTAIWRIRELRGSSLVELMLVCAVITILVTRAYLALTGYPQVGGATLHIAHMLWGGLLMLIGALIFFQAADRAWKPAIAIIFGVGFGLFIDEVGKFVTRDNDYFFQPAVAIMYVIFLLIFFSTRFIAKIDQRHPEEYLYFATETLARSFVGTVSETERTLALKNVDQSGIISPEVDALRRSLRRIKTSHDEDSRAWQAWDDIWERCQTFLASQLFQRLIFWAIILHAASFAIVLLFFRNQALPQTFTEWFDAAWQIAAGLLQIAGIIAWYREKRLLALRLFYYAMLVMLFIGQIFIFASSQFYGLIELTVNIAILVGLRGTIESQTKDEVGQEI